MPIKRLLVLILCPTLSLAHELEARHQYWWLKGPNTKSWRQDLQGLVKLKPGHALRWRTTHFERFDESDQQLMLAWRFKTRQHFWELSHADGAGNQVLAIRETQGTYGQALMAGLDGQVNLKAQGHANNDLHLAAFSLNKEWRGGFFLYSTLLLGRATFHRPAQTQDVWGTALRAGRYREDAWKLSLFLTRGEEAQPQILRAQTRPLRFVSYGLAGEYVLTGNLTLAAELERSYYPQVDTRFDSLTARLLWSWGET